MESNRDDTRIDGNTLMPNEALRAMNIQITAHNIISNIMQAKEYDEDLLNGTISLVKLLFERLKEITPKERLP